MRVRGRKVVAEKRVTAPARVKPLRVEGQLEPWQQTLVAENTRLVPHIAKEFYRGPIPDDVIAEGYLALCFAARRYDPKRNVKYSSYASYWIRALLLTQIVKGGQVYYLTTNDLRKGFYRFRGAWKALLNEGKETTVANLAKKLDIDEKTAETLYLRMSPRDFSLDDTYENGDSFELGTDEGNPENAVGGSERQEFLRRTLQDALDELGERDAYIIRQRYLADPQWTLAEVGETLGLSRERVRQLEARSFNRLRKLFPKEVKFQLAIE